MPPKSVVESCVTGLTTRLMAGPYQPPSDSYNETPEEIRVMAMCYGSGSAPTMAVMLDSDGEMTSHLKLNFFATRAAPGDTRRDEEITRLTDYIIEHNPHVIAIGAEMEARKLYDEISVIVKRLQEERKTSSIHVTYVDTEIAKIFQTSPRAETEFPEYPPVLRQAISVGRLLQDPLIEISAMAANDSREIQYLKLNPLQDMVPRDILSRMLDRCLVNVVNAVGVDLNGAVSHKHAAGPLQFVAGLGPRKAVGLTTSIFRRGGKISTREELETLMGPCVFTNCAGFLRIFEKYFNRNEDLQVLDNTRIHPDDYNLVRKMAKDALEKSSMDDDLVELMRKPRKLDDIDLDLFAEELEKNNKPRKRSTLYAIKEEINYPYKDPRIEYKDPEPAELFRMLTGETDSTLRPGMLVSGRIVTKNDKVVRVRLDNGLTGVILAKEVTDSGKAISDLGLEEGISLMCRVLEVKKDETLTVFLSCRNSDLSSTRWEEAHLNQLRRQEPFLQVENYDTEKKSSGGQTQKKKAAAAFMKRHIDHPQFKNVGFQESEELLADKDNGEVIIRPSSKGYNYLTITVKFYRNVYAHITLKEERKMSTKTIGKKLIIGNQTFEDLNEVLMNYVEPMNGFAQEMINFRVFRDGSEKEIDQMLHDEKRRNSSRIPYFVHISYDYPGKFMLSYLASSKPRREFVTVTHEGYRFRNQMFKNPEKLISWFKQNYHKPIPASSSSSSSNSSSNSRGKIPSSSSSSSSHYNPSSSSNTANNNNNIYDNNMGQTIPSNYGNPQQYPPMAAAAFFQGGSMYGSMMGSAGAAPGPYGQPSYGGMPPMPVPSSGSSSSGGDWTQQQQSRGGRRDNNNRDYNNNNNNNRRDNRGGPRRDNNNNNNESSWTSGGWDKPAPSW